MEQPFKVDTNAVFEKKREKLLASFERADEQEKEREARKQYRRERELRILQRKISTRAEKLEGALNRTDEPRLLYKWLMLDSWTFDQGMDLLVGIEPCDDEKEIERRRFDLGFDASKEHAERMFDKGYVPLRTLSGFELWNDYSDYISTWENILRGYMSSVKATRRLLTEYWSSGQHPERPSPKYFIEWSVRKNIRPYWLDWAMEKGLLEVDSSALKLPDADPILSDREKGTLQKQLAVLALLLSEKSGKYRRGEKLNVKQVADSVEEIIAALPDADGAGLSGSSIRANIKAGLDLLTK